MKTEEIIKILLVLGVLYLLLTCTLNENFAAGSDDNSFSVAIVSKGKLYRLVSFFDLNDDYKKVLLHALHEEHKTDANKEFSFISSGNETVLATTVPENAPDIKPNNISKVPLIIIPNEKVSEYTKSTLRIRQTADGFMPAGEEKYLFWNHLHSMLFYSIYDLFVQKSQIKGKFTETDSVITIEPITFKNKEKKDETVQKFKMIDKTISFNNKTLNYFILSKDTGNDVEFHKYSNGDQLTEIMSKLINN